ncbi:hypothetical protein JCM19233_6742 [Vibrio astriarenae]|nr:hypothetical protein JCM19233_6742 [Vibrio sp. C7]
MKFQQFIVIPIMVAFLAFTIQIIDQVIAPMLPIENVGFGGLLLLLGQCTSWQAAL